MTVAKKKIENQKASHKSSQGKYRIPSLPYCLPLFAPILKNT